MKCFQSILNQCVNQTHERFGPLQFAYKTRKYRHWWCNSHMLNQAYTRLENAELFVHILFADLSSAFNTVQPHHMVTKMLNLVVSHRLTLWITDIMVGRVQSVKCRNDRTGLLFFFLSPRSMCTGVLQGTVLCTLCCWLQKWYSCSCLITFSNNIALVNMVLSPENRREVRRQSVVRQLSTDGVALNGVDSHDYLGTILDRKFTLNDDTDTIFQLCRKEAISSA